MNSFCFSAARSGRVGRNSAEQGMHRGLNHLSILAPLKNKKNNSWDGRVYEQATPTGFVFWLFLFCCLLAHPASAATLSDPAVDSYNVRIGTQTFDGLYQFTTNTLL